MLCVLADVGGIMAGLLQVMFNNVHTDNLDKHDQCHACGQPWQLLSISCVLTKIVNLSIDLVGDQVTWGNHKDQLREWAEKVTNIIRRIREKSIVGLLPRPSELCLPKVYNP